MADSVRHTAVRPGLIWGVDFRDGRAAPVDEIDLLRGTAPGDAFRWLHFNLADQRTCRWLAVTDLVPPFVREVLLSTDVHQRALAEHHGVACVLQDLERDFDDGEIRVGVVRVALMPGLMITARHHPLRSGDVVKRRIAEGAPVGDAAAAFDLQLSAMVEVVRTVVVELDETIQGVEDELLKGGRGVDNLGFISMRSLMARLHRQLSGGRAVLDRLEDDPHLSAALRASVGRALQRFAALDAELLSIQSQLRLLREELDLQTSQRTNQNLYVLSMMTALMMPATLVTGLFGMNVGGMPWTNAPAGGLLATLLAAGLSLLVYFVLRGMGLIRR
jgi:Mg2+ and Co2+ transporter CorA